MTGEPVNLPVEGGNDNANPSTDINDPSNWNFAEPDDEANQDAQEDGIDDDREPVEADDEGQEAEESEPDDDVSGDEIEDDAGDDVDGDAPPQDAQVNDDVVVTLSDGEKLPLSELKLGFMRDRDYRQKTQQVSNQRRDLEALATSVSQAVDAIADHLTKSLPPAPDPNLAITNPGEYTRRKAMHDHAMGQIAKVLETAHAPKDAVNKLTEQQHRELVASETAKLSEAFPQVRTQEGHKQFFDAAAQTARELGYSDEEIGGATDHRLFTLAHYARIGLKAEESKAKAAKKVANVPPVAPTKRQPSKNAAKHRSNRDAMKKLNQSGSIHDAMAVDWD